MKFRTEVQIAAAEKKVEIEDVIFTIGSCFSTEMAALFSQGQLQTFSNPFGTLFNPFSINKALKKIHSAEVYTQDDLINFDDTAISLDHHTQFNSRFPHQTLEKINTEIEAANQFLQITNWVIITYGSSFIYEFIPRKRKVANCHKIPGKYFEKNLMTHQEIVEAIKESISLLKDICKEDVQILFTVSPVRHTKDGMVENAHSKAKLLTAVHEVVSESEDCHYLPVYEIMMDDLRDYRFYKEDMLHPNSQAVNYIWEKFKTAYFSEETTAFIDENFKINKALKHNATDTKSAKYLEFVKALEEKIKKQQAKVRHKIF